jgi:hypothetical protein
MTLLKRPVLIIIGLVAVGGSGFGYYWTQMLPPSQVEVRVQTKPNPCTDVYAPLFVAVINHSQRTVTKVSYRLIGKKPGNSTNLAAGDGIRQFDGATVPGGGLGYCQAAPLLTERFLSWQSLEWSAEIVSVSFE